MSNNCIPDEDYSRNASCALHLISTRFLYNTESQCVLQRFDNYTLLLISTKCLFFQISNFRSFYCFVAILAISLKLLSHKDGQILFNVGSKCIEDRNIRLVNIITIKNGQSRDTSNTGHTRHRSKTNTLI